MFSKKVLLIAVLPAVLAACSGGGPGASAQSSSDAEAARARLPDFSATVERVQGEDPTRYFIGNLRALNAVDLDGNGLWDDIEARVQADSVLAGADLRMTSLYIRAFQQTMQWRTHSDARDPQKNLYPWALSCIGYHSLRLHADDRAAAFTYRQDVSKRLREAIVTSRERVLALKYSDGLASGSVLPVQAPAEGSCGR
jgi:hypothetical protein